MDKEKQEKQDQVWLDTMHTLDKVMKITRNAIECGVSKEETDLLMKIQNELYKLVFKSEKTGGEK